MERAINTTRVMMIHDTYLIFDYRTVAVTDVFSFLLEEFWMIVFFCFVQTGPRPMLLFFYNFNCFGRDIHEHEDNAMAVFSCITD